MNFRTQIYFGTSVREDGTEFGVLHCRQTSSESHINNGIQNSVLSSVNWDETSWTYGIYTFDVVLQKS